ncbi:MULTISPECIES: helix-turn-helix transcriptional regulator [unclassified Arthrobacter]|uniref:ArsR/SmtB family transcription factor n=1 Tax=unclassified Arthrobacter TaxID=235627 RepID=UPI001C613DCB
MPRLVQAKNPLPEDAAQAVSILGLNPLRAEVLRHLFLHPEGSSSGEIGEAVGTGHRTVHNHLIQLEEQGIVATHDGKGRRLGQRVLYVVNPDAFDQAVAALLAHIKGTAAGES